MDPDESEPISVQGWVSGRVQGVGFRYFVLQQANAAGLAGYVRNLQNGQVEFLLHGNSESINRVIGQIRIGPRFSRVQEVRIRDVESKPETDFVIR